MMLKKTQKTPLRLVQNEADCIKYLCKINVEIQIFYYIDITAVCKDEFVMLVRIEGMCWHMRNNR